MIMYWDEDEMRYELILSKGKGFATTKLQNKLIELVKESYWGFCQDKENAHDIMGDCIVKLLTDWYKIDLTKYQKTMPYFVQMIRMQINYSLRIVNGLQMKYDINRHGYQKISLDSLFENQTD